jgi:cysteine desulfurase / selenocysteine lyase
MSFHRGARRSPATELDVGRIRRHFDFVGTGRVVTNNAASTQPPRELLDLYRSLAPWYESVHRGQSTASRRTTELFESSYDTIAAWLNAPSRRNIATFRNTTEAHNAVMYTLMTEFRDGDNVVTTMLEHNSNFVPWYASATKSCPGSGDGSSAGSRASIRSPAAWTWPTWRPLWTTGPS